MKPAWIWATLTACAGALFLPWTSVPAHQTESGPISDLTVFLFFIVDDGVHAFPPADGVMQAWGGALLILAAVALVVLAALRMYVHEWWTLSGWLGIATLPMAAGTVLATYGHDEIIYRAYNPNIGWPIGPGAWAALAAVLLMVASAIANRPRGETVASDVPVRRKQTWFLAGALAAMFALFFVPIISTHVTIDQTETYSLGFPEEGTFDGTFHFLLWGRYMEAHPDDTAFHPWWDNHYIGKAGNGGLYAAGVMHIASLIGIGVGFGWRNKWFHVGLAGLVGLTFIMFWIGAVGELDTSEYVSHDFLWPSWGHLLGVAAITSLVFVARAPPVSVQEATILPPLPDRPDEP